MNKDELIVISHKIADIEQKCLTNLNLISLYELENLEVEQKEKEKINADTIYSNEAKRKIELDKRLKSDVGYQRKI